MKVIEVDTAELAAVERKLEGVAVDGVYCVSDRSSLVAAQIAEKYQLPHISSQAVKILRSKRLTYDLCRKFGIAVPKTIGSLDHSNLKRIVESMSMPCVMKRSMGTGSTDVILCSSVDELETCYNDISRRITETEEVLIQEYVHGPVVSVESVTFDGETEVLGVTDRILGKHPNFVEIGLSFPASIGNECLATLSAMVRQALGAAGVVYGACHSEFVLSEKGPVLIEINPRLGGMHIGDFISYATGRSIFSELIGMALGQRPAVHRLKDRHMMEFHIYPYTNGQVVELSGVELARKIPGIIKAEACVSVGETVSIPTNYQGRKLATVISTGETSDLCKMRCFQAVASIVPKIRVQLAT
ncbi:ATP-grasp domain-containing protein [Rhizobium leguminosarum]|nr:ATP-grasp domain-containing protein [Rhizobium leguminosarum]